MRMEYKLLKTQRKGFCLTREPEVVEGELFITFTGAPEDATAIFENAEGDSLYRLLAGGSCAIPADFLRGEISVCVTVLNGSESEPKYVCEGIYTKTLGGGIVVVPNGLDFPKEIIDVCVELQSVREDIAALAQKDKELDEKLVQLLHGYNII